MNTDHVVLKGNDLWCKACGQREPLQLPFSVKDLSHFCQTWAKAHKHCAIAEQSNLINELRAINNTLLAENNRLKEAIAAVPDTASYEWSQHRLRLRRAAGLENKP